MSGGFDVEFEEVNDLFLHNLSFGCWLGANIKNGNLSPNPSLEEIRGFRKKQLNKRRAKAKGGQSHA